MAYDVESEPGRFAKAQESQHARVALAFLVLAVAAAALVVVVVLQGGAGPLTLLALLFVAVASRTIFDDRLDARIRWGKGGNGEAAVGAELETLRRQGFIVMHDLENGFAGNVDHLVSGPTGVFIVETKFRAYRDADLPVARRRAQELAALLGARWVQPVICLATRGYEPRKVKGVVILGRAELVPYLRSESNPTVPFERLAAFADAQ